MQRRFAALFCMLVLVGLLVSCSSKPKDQTIAQNIQTKVASNPQTQDSEVAVEAKDGRVTLQGKAKNQAAHDEIERIAKEEPGVSSVDDHLSITSNERASAGTPPSAASASIPEPKPAPAPPPKPVVVPAGTVITIRTNQALSTKTAQTGGSFNGSVMTPITIDGKVVVPAGSEVTGIVKDAKKAGKFKGGATLVLGINSVAIKGHIYNIETEFFQQSTTGKGKRTAGVIVGGTGVGAAIGGIAGGGTGAAIGALAGAAAGTVGAGATGNKNFELPAESALSFKLVQPLTLQAELASGE